jgi:hypothetical protein
MLDRFRFYKSILGRWVVLLSLGVWACISNRDTVVGLIKPYVSDPPPKWLSGVFMMENWPWYVWAIGSLLILSGYILDSGYRKFRTERDKAATLQEGMKPKLEILWKPGEQTYVMPYPDGSPNPTIHYRICIVNRSTAQAVTDIVVTLDRLAPYVLNCVPCTLRLMNNILPPGGDPKKTPATAIQTFSLNPGATKFVDLMEHNPGLPNIQIWHTVVPEVSTQVPAQEYEFTIKVTASNSTPVSKHFELFKNGSLWGLREANA